ncbi:Na+/H+ antiporter subunit C [Paraburkholderia sp. J76]|uniref:Na+/H+ antiporter subunit C n=1 Tax=Paraburkholderia sp. J76 TaxID=2805439 RepID=UPI002ABD69C8|nr:Na+/H+ antiporter subunit C [Paraburkholderia sp. J76]
MEAAFAITLGVLCASGIYLLLSARVLPVILGITLFSYAINLFLLGMGRLSTGKPPVIAPGAQYADPVPQALVLTAIVIGFAMTAFTVVLALRALAIDGTDHVDGGSAHGHGQEMRGE